MLAPVNERQWLGDFLGVAQETWYEIWVGTIPVVVGGVFTLFVALLTFRLGRLKEQRSNFNAANLNVARLLAEIANQDLSSGPEFDKSEMQIALNRWGATSPLPRKWAGNINISIMRYLVVWRFLCTTPGFQDRTLECPYSKSALESEYTDFLFRMMILFDEFMDANRLKVWVVSDNLYIQLRNLMNRRIALDVMSMRTGSRRNLQGTHVPPLHWRPLIWAAVRLGWFKRVVK